MRKVIVGMAALALAATAYAAQPRTGAGQLSTTALEIGSIDNRVALTVCNEDSTILIRCSGNSATAFSNGIAVSAGNCWTTDEQAGGANSAKERQYCASMSGTPNYSYWETVR